MSGEQSRAKQITAENIEELAQWCGKKTYTFAEEKRKGLAHHVVIEINETDIATVTDWVVKTGDTFKFITDEEYMAILASEEKDAQRYAAVVEIIKKAMLKQDAATYHGEGASTGTDRVAEQAAQEILEII